MTVNYSEIHKDIIESCKKGNAKAQNQLYKLYAKAMFNICMRMMNSASDAEDLLQESFTEAFLHLKNFRYDSAFGAWLKRIVINKCINALKKRKADLIYVEDYFSIDKKEEENNSGNEMELSVNKVYKAMEQLADGYRVIFSLYLIEGYDHSEIGEILGISESTSKSQFLRAKRKVREILLKNDSEASFLQHIN